MRYFDTMSRAFHRCADAAARISGSEQYPDISGRVLFYQLAEGVLVRAEIEGLPRTEDCASPIFAFHVHCGGRCAGNPADPFADVGTHYNPNDCPHPYHAGDMPPLFTLNGKAYLAFLTGRFTVSEIIGKTVIIHDRPDDFTTQPSGAAGTKIACGVIRPIRK